MKVVRRVVPAALYAVACAAYASPARAEPKTDAAAFEPKPKAPNEKTALQLDEADLSDLVPVIAEMTGKKFVFGGPKLAKVKASVYAPQKVTVAEAYQAFLAVLAANGLTIVTDGGFNRIVESQDIARQLTPLERGDLPREERYVTRIHRLQHLSAEVVAQDASRSSRRRTRASSPTRPATC